MMAPLSSIVQHLDQRLETSAIADYPGAHNGLQVENSGDIRKIGAAVDACEAVFVEAARRGVSLLIVHHGLFWAPQRLTGAMYRKAKTAITHDLAVYSSHLPLDLHPVFGNCALLAKALGFRKCEPAFPFKGRPIGLTTAVSLSRDELARRLETVLGTAPHLAAGGPSRTCRIGILTGGAGGEVAMAAAEGVDTFITGEGPHHSYTLAEELGINLFYGGHYATETFGVKALAAHLSRKFRLPWEFIDHPTGL
jgi:dinuclear metal center YbgI/SA1388 family protein